MVCKRLLRLPILEEPVDAVVLVESFVEEIGNWIIVAVAASVALVV